MNILSIYASHDGCVTYVQDGKIKFHTQIDRYNRFKHSAFPNRSLFNLINSLKVDKLIISHGKDHAMGVWKSVLDYSDNLKKTLNEDGLIYYGDKYHHMFHAYCVSTWNKDVQDILVADGGGTTVNGQVENESHYKNGNSKFIKLETNQIGKDYENFTREHFGNWFHCGKTMAWSLYDRRPRELQKDFEGRMLNLIDKWELKNFLYTGGCAQNVIFNSWLFREKQIFCDPFNGDFGLSLGAVNYYLNNTIYNDRIYLGVTQPINTDLFLNEKIKKVSQEEVCNILVNQPVAIFQSKSEQGQRGLGNRSLLMNPLDKNANEKLNTIKKREWFRPFACSVLEEDSDDWFHMFMHKSPHMMYIFKLRQDKYNILQSGIADDNTSRIQTVSRSDNPNYYNLLSAFKKKTGVPIIVNTSLNLPGEVLVETLQDLYMLFKESNLNYIYFPEIETMVEKKWK